MTADDPLERAFAQLRADNAKGPASNPSPAELDALLDARENQAERERVAAVVVQSQEARQQLAQLLAIDAEVASTVRALHQWRFTRLLGATLAVAAALLIACFVFGVFDGGGGDRIALRGRIQVAEAEGPKDPAYPGYTRAERSEHLVFSEPVAAAITWVALDVGDGRVWQRAGGGNEPFILLRLVPQDYRGVLLVAATTGDGEAIAARLQGLRTAELRAAASTGGAVVARLLAATIGPASFGDQTLVHVLEIF